MIVISMKILRDFVKSVPGHNIFYREITKKFLIRPVHFYSDLRKLVFQEQRLVSMWDRLSADSTAQRRPTC